MTGQVQLDALDLALLAELTEDAQVGPLHLSRSTGVARATVAARLQRMQAIGVIAAYRADIDIVKAGFAVQAYITLQIVQGAIDAVQRDLEAIPGVLEAYATTGEGDVLCRVAAISHEALQHTLVELNRSASVARSTSVVVLSEIVAWRTLPLLRSNAAPGAGRSAMPSSQLGRAGEQV